MNSELTRYRIKPVGLGEIDLDVDDINGEWVAYEHVKTLINEKDKLLNEMFSVLFDGMKRNIDYGCRTKCMHKFKSAECEGCSKMRKLKVIEKFTGLTWGEIEKKHIILNKDKYEYKKD